MKIRTIHAISWENARKILGKKDILPNLEFFEILDKLSDSFKSSNRDYVYYLKLSFGEKIIDKGNRYLGEFEVIGNEYKRTKDDFNREIYYSSDPLGIVLKNYIEVYTENRSKGDIGGSYTFPLNILKEGDLFGVFGTLDNFTNDNNYNISRDWYARAGNASFSIAFPFHNAYERGMIDGGYNYTHLSSAKDQKKEITPGDNKVNFIKELIDDWEVEIAYIPIHYFEEIPVELKSKVMLKLYEIGWSQSAPLRNALFEDTTVFDIISSYTYLKHDKLFLSRLYNYLHGIVLEETIVMKPLTGNHVIITALDRFKEKNKDYYKSTKSNEPLPFIYDDFKNCADWGLIPAYHLPIVYCYTIRSLNDLLMDIELIGSRTRN